MSELSKLILQPEVPNLIAAVRIKEEVVEAMFNFPDYSILPETDQQRDVLDSAKTHFKFVHLWLQYRLLGRFDYHDTLNGNALTLQARPYADLSVATLDFCSHIYPRLRPEGVDSFEQLWGICEYSKSLAVLRATGYYGDRAPGSKRQLMKGFAKARQAHVELEEGDLSGERVPVDNIKEHVVETLIESASSFANIEPVDRDLKSHVYKYRQALVRYHDIILKRNKSLVLTQMQQPSKPKSRGRGRPPKKM